MDFSAQYNHSIDVPVSLFPAEIIPEDIKRKYNTRVITPSSNIVEEYNANKINAERCFLGTYGPDSGIGSDCRNLPAIGNGPCNVQFGQQNA